MEFSETIQDVKFSSATTLLTSIKLGATRVLLRESLWIIRSVKSTLLTSTQHGAEETTDLVRTTHMEKTIDKITCPETFSDITQDVRPSSVTI